MIQVSEKQLKTRRYIIDVSCFSGQTTMEDKGDFLRKLRSVSNDGVSGIAVNGIVAVNARKEKK